MADVTRDQSLPMRIEAQGNSPSASGNPDLDYAPGQPNLYKMMRFKQRLIAELGLERGYEAFRASVNCVGSAEPRLLPLIGERGFSVSHGLLFAETAKSGEAFVHLPPAVSGEGNHQRVHGASRSQYVACIADARVRGRSAAIVADGSLLLDFQGDELTSLDDELEWDPAVFHAESGQAWYIPPRDDGARLEIAEAFSLLGAHSDFFGHWMCEYLPKYTAALLSGKLGPTVPVLIDAHMPATHRQSLELLFGNGLPIIEVPSFAEVRVRRLWCAPTLMYMPLHEKRNERFSLDSVSASPDHFEPVIREMVRRADIALTKPELPASRIFLARRLFRHRKLVNHERIEAAARERGFQIVYPEDHSFAEQASLLRNSRSVVAAEGSAIFLAFFSSPDTRLLILSHPFTDVLADYNGILGRHGVEIRVLTGPMVHLNRQTAHDSDYEIDPSKLERLLDDWLVDPAAA